MSALSRWWASPPPSTGLEVSPSRVTAVSLTRSSDGPLIAAHAVRPLATGALVPSLTADNMQDRTAVAQAVRDVLAAVGRPRRVALVIPDTAAKVSMVKFEKVPHRTEDLEQLVRWQVRKAVPFPIEAAQVGFGRASDVDGGHEFLVVVMRRDIVESYESLVHAAGAHVGLVDLASFNLINLVLAGDKRSRGVESGDWLLVHLAAQASTLAIVRGAQLVFYRSRLAEAQESLVDLVHQTAMYYEDRLGGRGFERVLLAASGDALDAEGADVRQTLEDRLRSRVQLVEPLRAVQVGDRAPATSEQLADMAAPLGVVLREVA